MTTKKTKKPTAKKKAAAASKHKPREIRVTGAEPVAPAGTSAQKVTKPARGDLQKLSVEELRALYAEVVGRPTDSHHHAYLCWKIREARKGRIRVGPIQAREPRGPQQVLSIRVDVDAVPLLDAAWRKHGAASRNDLVLRAIGRELAALGESDAATRFTVPGAS
jgi:hypothetical protein